jgi:hypothetical protein
VGSLLDRLLGGGSPGVGVERLKCSGVTLVVGSVGIEIVGTWGGTDIGGIEEMGIEGIVGIEGMVGIERAGGSPLGVGVGSGLK